MEMEETQSAEPVYPKSEFFLALLIYIFAFVLSVVHNCIMNDAGRLFIFDSKHYLETSKQLAIAGEHLLGSALNPLPCTGELLMLDGLGMPILGCLGFILSKLKEDPNILVCLQSSVHALTVSTVYISARLMKLTVKSAALPALLYAIYPPALVAAGTFLSEPICALLMAQAAFICLCCMSKPKSWSFFLLGIVTEIITLSRTALVVPMIIMIAIASRSCKKSWSSLLFFVAGFLPVLTLWCALTFYFCGTPNILPSRVPSENIAIGCDTSVGGWETIPVPPITKKYLWTSPATILFKRFIQQPQEMLNLEYRKVERLWFGCFNDFHDTVFGISYESQLIFHALLVSATIMSFVITVKNLKERNSTFFAPLLCFAGIIGHFVFVPFESLARYAFSATPLMFLVVCISISPFFRENLRVKLLISVLGISFLLYQLFYSFAPDNEASLVLRKGESAIRLLEPLELSFEPKWAAIIFDTNSDRNNFEIFVNGHKAQQSAVSLESIPTGFSYQATAESVLNTLCSAKKITRGSLRQWSLVLIEPKYISKGTNKLELLSKADNGEINFQTQVAEANTFTIPALRYVSATKMFSSHDGIDPRVPDSVMPQRVRSLSAGLKGNHQFRIYLLLSANEIAQLDAETGHKGSCVQLY
jgi:hypothetical protein